MEIVIQILSPHRGAKTIENSETCADSGILL